jgi:hypothetical protein
MILALVNLGEPEPVHESDPNRTKIVDPATGFDSVKGNTNGSDIYIVYANKKAYP